MRTRSYVHVWIGLFVLACVAGSALLLAQPQPTVAQAAFATNTPHPSPTADLLANTIDAPRQQYALRLWTERDLIDVLAAQLSRLHSGDEDQQQAIRLTLHELEHRFPGAPRQTAQRQRIIGLMMDAPIGSVDMRSMVRPHIVNLLSERRGEIDPSRGALLADGFLIEITPLNLDGDETGDALLTVRYPAEAAAEEALYVDYLPVLGVEGGGYRLAPFQIDLPAAPFGPVQQVRLIRAGDVNRDGLDDIAVVVDRGSINEELVIVGWRSDVFISLVQPGEHIEMGQLLSWPVDAPDITVAHYRVESGRWNCLSARPVTWRWSGNFYRPVRDLTAAYRNLSTVGCALAEADPIFAQPPDEALQTITGILADETLDSQGAERGSMALAMLYYLTGQTASAEAQIMGLAPLAEDDLWVAQQIAVFEDATIGEATSPVAVCAALNGPDSTGACDVDQVLDRVLEDNPILRDGDVETQLRNLGLPVQRIVTVSQVGRADRQLVQFNLPGASWWSFAPTSPEVYVAAIEVTPAGYDEPQPRPEALVLPQTVYDVLLVNRSPIEALNVIDNVRREAPDLPLTVEARYIQALSYDLLANRDNAHRAYYDLWMDFPDTTWGSLAGVHLEKR